MSVNYPVSLLNTRLGDVVTAIDSGATNGSLQLLDGSNNLLSTFGLSRPCATVTGAVLTFNGLALVDPAATGSGTSHFARVNNGDGTIVISGLTVGTSSASDIVLSNASILAGQTIALTAATITGN